MAPRATLPLTVYQVDSFTTRPFTGNPAGVVPDASDLTPRQMQAIARELNNSETAFVFSGDSGLEEVSVRFFTPTTEVPICGHATIAAHFVLAMEGAPLGTRLQRSAAGVMQIDSEEADGGLRIWMHQRPATLDSPLGSVDVERTLAALGLESHEVDDALPVQVVSTGHSKVLVPVRSSASIARLSPDLSALKRLSHDIGCNGYYPFTLRGTPAGAVAHGRMFAPAIGVAEDPVTGNAAGCLGAYALEHRLVAPMADGQIGFVVDQGAEVGRPGTVTVRASRAERDQSIHVRIAGQAVVVFRTTMAVSMG
jgi:PhzF family phenazine biosynthesis protein